MARKPNILLVDDYEVNLDLLEAYLELSGIPLELHKARNGKEAYAIIEQYTLDLILLDVMLPDTSGYEICRWVKEHKLYQNIPIIMITALNDKKDMLQGLQAGADEFLTKPVDSHELILRVKNLLKMKSIANDLDDKYMQLHRELMIATELQKSFLPHKIPQYENVHIDVLYKPSSFIGGDFYDFIKIDDTHLGVLICDVKGHGVASAMITATIKFQIYDLKKQYLSPGLFLEQLNNRLEQFFRGTENDYFVTAFYGVLDFEQRKFLFSNAGHSAPGLYSGNMLQLLDTEIGLPLGILPDMLYEQKEVQLNTGDELFLYTDGIFELSLRGRAAKQCSSIHELFDENEPVTILQLRQLKEEITNLVAKEQIADDINYISIELLS